MMKKGFVMSVIEKMKEKIPKHPVLQKTFNELVENGLSEDEALDIMIYGWLEHMENLKEK